MDIPATIKKILIHNHWDEFNYRMMKDCYINKLKQAYSKFEYPMNDNVISKIALFYNMKLKVGNSDILYFDVKKIKKYTPNAVLKIAAKLGVNNVIYLADIHPGYLTVWIDEQERVWAKYDNLIYYYGNNIFNGIQNIVSGNILEISSNPNAL